MPSVIDKLCPGRIVLFDIVVDLRLLHDFRSRQIAFGVIDKEFLGDADKF
jgi:hypothetical protein